MARQLKISGRMTVKNLKAQFKSAFGGTLRVYNGQQFADDNATLASIRKSNNRGGEFEVRGNLQVGTFERRMMEIFGIRVQVANADNTALVRNDVTLANCAKG